MNVYCITGKNHIRYTKFVEYIFVVFYTYERYFELAR